MDELLTRQMPHSLEAEQAVIGSMLIDPSCVADMLELVKPDDFYLQQNKDIFTTIYTMFNYSMDIDPVTVMDQMKQSGVYDEERPGTICFKFSISRPPPPMQSSMLRS